ncbi:MAG TPA: hypothetical protein VKQ52_09925, partial [Puia sp.]|nr:hypothetical protein [Puia sp.]
MIRRLLILFLFFCGACLAARSQQPGGDTAKKAGIDTVGKGIDTAQKPVDSAARADSLHRADSVRKAADSLHKSDSLKKVKADTLLSAAALLRQLDSLNTAPAGPVDSLKMKLDAQLNGAANQRPGVSPGMPGGLQRQGANPGYAPSLGAGNGSGGASPSA